MSNIETILRRKDEQDTHLRAYPRDSGGRDTCIVDTEAETLDGTGFSETLKFSNCTGVVVANKTFTGAPSEDDIDIVRGANYLIGPNFHGQSRPGGQNITIKGGVDRARLCGDFGRAVIGMYSNYDRWFAMPRTGGIEFDADARGTVVLWWADMPRRVPGGVRIKRVPRLVVAAYFIFRSAQQALRDLWIAKTRKDENAKGND